MLRATPDGLRERFVSVSMGKFHALNLSTSGRVFSWGCAGENSHVRVTTVAGNCLQRHTHADASYLIRRLNLDGAIPVLRGAAWWPPQLDSCRPRGRRAIAAASDFIVQTVMENADKRVDAERWMQRDGCREMDQRFIP